VTYRIAEKFKSPQGEGIYAGTPMAFLRFCGCSVGKKICHACDTDFDETLPWRGGGEFTAEELISWAYPYKHICLTGGEPLDQDLQPLVFAAVEKMFHVETSGTKPLPPLNLYSNELWVCISPKPGFLEEMIIRADEVKVIVPGLGTDASLRKEQRNAIMFRETGIGLPSGYIPLAERTDFRWPTLADALRWEASGKIVFIQPRNGKFDIDKVNLMYCLDLMKDHPQLRLSYQAHKLLHVQ
jgi:organic radical activating enzyme